MTSGIAYAQYQPIFGTGIDICATNAASAWGKPLILDPSVAN